jgi:hypothetical protein
MPKALEDAWKEMYGSKEVIPQFCGGAIHDPVCDIASFVDF